MLKSALYAVPVKYQSDLRLASNVSTYHLIVHSAVDKLLFCTYMLMVYDMFTSSLLVVLITFVQEAGVTVMYGNQLSASFFS
jgi:hypothetical protein